jgi:hypothetical protein
MADSDAVRTRRSRLHRNGDHSLCRPDRCNPSRPLAVVPEARALSAACDRVTEGILARLDDDDPRRIVAELARRLAELADEDRSNISAVRELRLTAAWLAENTTTPAVDELETFLASISTPAFRNPGD